jgi:hypothetical protein
MTTQGFQVEVASDAVYSQPGRVAVWWMQPSRCELQSSG